MNQLPSREDCINLLRRASVDPLTADVLFEFFCGQEVATRRYRQRVAAQMLRSGVGRPQAYQMLQRRFGISRRSAYRLIDAALDEVRYAG
ncbi:MAG: hypothetical protein HQL47_07805 [Gammaproteobacteria bacterium]|nr:hypothetical protein [Gammaproteobacteria bacterium]